MGFLNRFIIALISSTGCLCKNIGNSIPEVVTLRCLLDPWWKLHMTVHFSHEYDLFMGCNNLVAFVFGERR